MRSSVLSFFFGDSMSDLDMPEIQQFQLKYDGESLADHTIDVNDLAPALMALGDAIQEANSLANKDKSRIAIKVKATEAGCFQVSIQAIQTVANDAVELLAGPKVTALANLLAMLGFVGVTGASVMVLVKRMRGKMPQKVSETSGGEIEMDTGSGAVIITKLEWEMFQSRKIRKAIYGILRPAENVGIETVEFIDEKQESIKITKTEVQYFIPPDEQQIPLEELPPRDTWVHVVHLWFKDSGKWKFSEGTSEWTAEMKDQEFLKQLLKDEVVIRANDLLKVTVKQTQFTRGDSIVSEYEILKVIEHKHAGRQIPLV